MGGSDMNIWGATPHKQLVNLVAGSGYENKSSYTSPKGIIDVDNHTYTISPRDNNGSKSMYISSNAKNMGGSDMNVWSLNNDDILEKLVAGGNYENKSSYTSPKGIIDVDTEGYYISPRQDNGEISMKTPADYMI